MWPNKAIHNLFFFKCFVDCASLYNLAKKPTWCTTFLSMFISFLYMFRVTMCPSSQERTVGMRHLVFVTVWTTVWYAPNMQRKEINILRKSDVFSTVHHSIGLFLQPTLMHNSITTCMSQYYPRHVSGLDMPILRRMLSTGVVYSRL